MDNQLILWNASDDGTEMSSTVYVIYDDGIPVLKVLNDWMNFTWRPTYEEAESEMLHMMELYYPDEKPGTKFHIMAVDLKRKANIVV